MEARELLKPEETITERNIDSCIDDASHGVNSAASYAANHTIAEKQAAAAASDYRKIFGGWKNGA